MTNPNVDGSLLPAGLPSPLEHPIIGQVQGRYGKGVVQYLGIKYASLDHRLADPKVVEYPLPAQMDATKYGPPVLTPARAVDAEMSFIGEHLPVPELPPMSDLHGLNLNVTVPREGGARLPVIVYIHGGGFTFGSSAYPHYDQSKMVELSALVNLPIVAVNINYRLGIAGFLASKELSGSSIKANRGLRDQRAALLWLKKYISGFGGDPERVTVIGQSAGAVSVNFHMHSAEPLFHQAMLFGGSFLMMKPAMPEIAESMYVSVTNSLGLGALAPEERVKVLLSIPQEKLVAHITPELLSLGPMVDQDVIPAPATFANLGDNVALPLPGREWCRRLFMIESQFDGSIFGHVNLNAREKGITAAFIQSTETSLGKESAKKLLKLYNIAQDTPDSVSLLAIIQFVTDIGFFAPAVRLAESWPGSSYVAHFNERNPFNSIYKGRANHLLDTAYMWGNYNQKYSQQNWIVARAMAETNLGFFSEKDSLPVFNASEEKPVIVYGPSEDNISSKVERLGSEGSGRNMGIFDLAAEVGGLDVLLHSMVAFLFGA